MAQRRIVHGDIPRDRKAADPIAERYAARHCDDACEGGLSPCARRERPLSLAVIDGLDAEACRLLTALPALKHGVERALDVARKTGGVEQRVAQPVAFELVSD